MLNFRKEEVDNKLPLVTIGVSSYNYERYILSALDSLLQQTYPNIELIIVDDHSQDSCPEIISNWIVRHNIHCTYIKHDVNWGITKTSNEIISLATGKYISLFATDDIMLPLKTEKQVQILEEAGDDYGICYCNPETIDEDNNALGLYTTDINFLIEGDILEAYLLKKVTIVTPSSLIKRSVYEKAGVYDERILIEDYNFWLRALAVSKAKYCDYPGIIYRQKKTSVVWNKWTKNKNELFNHDRILSNVYGARLISNNKVKDFLKTKNKKYLQVLAQNKSGLFFHSFKMLIQRGYVFSSLKCLFIYFFSSVSTKPSPPSPLL